MTVQTSDAANPGIAIRRKSPGRTVRRGKAITDNVSDSEVRPTGGKTSQPDPVPTKKPRKRRRKAVSK